MLDIPTFLVRKTFFECCQMHQMRAGAAELSVVLCCDEHIKELNSTWRGKDEATDVLSFPMEQVCRAELAGILTLDRTN